MCQNINTKLSNDSVYMLYNYTKDSLSSFTSCTDIDDAHKIKSGIRKKWK